MKAMSFRVQCTDSWRNLPLRFTNIAWLMAVVLWSGPRVSAGVGGGLTQAGLRGAYYTNFQFNGAPVFTRREVRLDFRPSTLPPGGAGQVGDAPYRQVPASGFSAVWSGGLIPRFSETYQFSFQALDGVQVRLRASGTTNWSVVIDPSVFHGGPVSGLYAMTAGTTYDMEVRMSHGSGPWQAQLSWSSPSTPLEVIEPLTQSGLNNPDWTAGFTDIVRGARNSWEPANGGTRPAMDTNGWPMGDGSYVFQESLNQGLDLDPLMQGKISFSFNGKATVSINGNVRGNSLVTYYDQVSNQTAGSFSATKNGWNASYFTVTNARRDGQANGPHGITNLRLMRPSGPSATTSHNPTNSLFTPQLLDAVTHFTVVRHQYVANQQRDWSERTLPTFFNQAGGVSSPPHYGNGGNSDNGVAWEFKVLLANETGSDLMISLPPVASGHDASETGSYLWKLANLIRFGSDGAEPYTHVVANPVYPPLNSNLRVYLELGNELWNSGGIFNVDWSNINSLMVADLLANNADYQAINYDGLPTNQDAHGYYPSMNTWRFRKIALRLMQISDIFRAVFGDDAMGSRVRTLYEWQYANLNDTAGLALTYIDRYFNNGDGQAHVSQPHPVSHWLWGGGGATYYGAVNGNGLTTFLTDPSFGIPTISTAGYHPNPSGSSWRFTGIAGIARPETGASEIPPAYSGQQMGYLTDHASISTSVTFPTNSLSPYFGISFKAVNRVPAGSTTADQENLRVYLDGTNDITARTFSQGNGYTPVAYDAGDPWYANNVFWTRSQYYYTRSFLVAPGSTHTVTIRGLGNVNQPTAVGQTAFIGEVRVTSVDRIFEDGIPGGGEATGQPVGEGIRETMNVEASWAKAFGLEQLSYEGGWSLGGDDGGSWVQLQAKYGDPRTGDAQRQFMDYFAEAGSAVNVFGTYAQWPSWGDYYAEQGLLDVGKYPIVKGIDNAANRLPPEPANGLLLPAVLTAGEASLADQADTNQGRINGAGGWLNWNVIAPISGAYTITPQLTSNSGSAVLLVDDVALASISGASTPVSLTRGLHSVKLRSVSSSAVGVSKLTISIPGAPPIPTWISAMDGDGTASLAWQATPGASSYEVRYGASPMNYTVVRSSLSNTNLTITGLQNGQQYYFVVLAENEHGLSLPSSERGLIPIGIGQPAPLAIWEFSGAVGNETASSSASASSRVVTTPLVRGTGLSPSTSDWAVGMRANRFGSEPSASQGHTYGTTLSQGLSKQQYHQFTITAAPGQLISVKQLSFRAFFQNGAGSAGITYSTDGVHFSSGISASGSASTSQVPWIVDLSNQPSLQSTAATVTVRICLYGLGAYQFSGLGDESGSDIVVTGTLRPVQLPLKISTNGPSGVRISWPDVGTGPILQSRNDLRSNHLWAPITNTSAISNGERSIILPFSLQPAFFRLFE